MFYLNLFLLRGALTPPVLLVCLITLAILWAFDYYKTKRKEKNSPKDKKTKDPVDKRAKMNKIDEDNDEDRFEKEVIKLVLSQKEFHISEVRDLNFYSGIEFVKEKLPIARHLVKKHEIEELQEYSLKLEETDCTLTIYTFLSQENESFIGLFIDSEDTHNNPELLEIIKLD